MDSQSLIHVQNEIVLRIAGTIGIPWEYCLIDFEREVVDEEPVEGCLALAFARGSGGWTRVSIRLPHDCYDLFLDMLKLMTSNEEGPWNSCTLEFDSAGKYRYSFSYEPPRRLNGVFDGDAFFENHVPRPL